jgi:ATP-dependent DNA helicase RecG
VRDGKGALPKDLWETYSAFSNTSGGDIFLGLKEKRNHRFELIGVGYPEKIIDEFWNNLNNPQKTNVNVVRAHQVRIVQIDGKSLIQIHVPRATRQQRPVYINGNPLKGTYRRFHSGDALQDEHVMRRMLAEQQEKSRDEQILKGFSLDDLDKESVQIYRHLLSAHKNSHPWLGLNDRDFLTCLGCWRHDRDTQDEGLTLAGLLMFGHHRPIHDALPNYFLEYQEQSANTESRWLDRLVPDGTWTGNLLDFYHHVIRKLEVDLKIPFAIRNNVRRDDTLIHQALREALINCLVHADYSDRTSIKVVKSTEGFVFRNPGLMRIPAEIALEGGESDCRNHILHELFLLIGLGERAGSGVPKIRQGWTEQGNSLRLFDATAPFDQTVMELNWGNPLKETAQETARNRLEKARLNQKQQEVLDYLRLHPSATRQELSRVISGISEDGIKYTLKVLQEQRVITRVGPNKTGYWKIK